MEVKKNGEQSLSVPQCEFPTPGDSNVNGDIKQKGKPSSFIALVYCTF